MILKPENEPRFSENEYDLCTIDKSTVIGKQITAANYRDYEAICINEQKGKSIKVASPFTEHFNLIRNQIKLPEFEKISNYLYYSEFVDFLFDKFLPYVFLWGGFIYQNLKTSKPVSHLTNGAIENFIKYRKQEENKSTLPSSYLN